MAKKPVAPYRTAIVRKKLSVPTLYLVDNDLIKGDLLDYGCGHGYDGTKLGGDLYDPYFYPRNKKMVFAKQYDTIICNYVLNVISELEQVKVIERIRSLLKPSGRAYVSVRRDVLGTTHTVKNTMQIDSQPDLESIRKTSTYEIYLVTKEGTNESKAN